MPACHDLPHQLTKSLSFLSSVEFLWCNAQSTANITHQHTQLIQIATVPALLCFHVEHWLSTKTELQRQRAKNDTQTPLRTQVFERTQNHHIRSTNVTISRPKRRDARRKGQKRTSQSNLILNACVLSPRELHANNTKTKNACIIFARVL